MCLTDKIRYRPKYQQLITVNYNGNALFCEQAQKQVSEKQNIPCDL